MHSNYSGYLVATTIVLLIIGFAIFCSTVKADSSQTFYMNIINPSLHQYRILLRENRFQLLFLRTHRILLMKDNYYDENYFTSV